MRQKGHATCYLVVLFWVVVLLFFVQKQKITIIFVAQECKNLAFLDEQNV